ncbi:phage coat protein [Clostridium facile]|uniref:phage coat protein n=1 Tax=Clostridium facile TaxID=2763035 RepID=UPI0025703510|nr:phage coat protein [Clostridium facile]
MAKFDSKSFNPQAFGAYVENVPNVKKTELARSKAIGTNTQAETALSTQTGSLYARIPYFGNIDSSTSQNNDGATDITSSNLTTYEQGFIVASRMDSWTERSFSQNITAGVNFMDEVGKQIANYKWEVRQDILLAILKGIFSMKTTGSGVAEKAAKEFIEKHVYDITNDIIGDEPGHVGVTSLNKAIQKAAGDNKNIFKLVVTHSEVATNLENLKLLKYLTYNDANGVEQDLTVGTWNGRIVLIDDNMPTAEIAERYVACKSTTEGALKCTTAGSGAGEVKLSDVQTTLPSAKENDYVLLLSAGTAYTSYVLGEGSIVLKDIGDSVPYEMSRDPKVNGGQDTLYARDRYICGAKGISFEKPSSLTASASNEDLSTGTNWNIINDGTNAIAHKAIPICKIVSLG